MENSGDEIWTNLNAVSSEFYRYEVSNFGRIKNISTGKIRKCTVTGGYAKVSLYGDSFDHSKEKSVHYLVLMSFKEQTYFQGAEVNHIDGNKLNNRLENLEFVTHTENVRHMRKISTRDWCDTAQQKKVLQYSVNGTFVAEYPSAHKAGAPFGSTGFKAISACCLGHHKHYQGFIWKYKSADLIENEVWRTIIINSVSVKVSDMGRICSNRNIITWGHKGPHGYMVHTVKGKKYKVHRLVMMAFAPENYSQHLVVDHINRDRADNRAANLRLVTMRENARFASAKAVIAKHITLDIVKTYDTIADAAAELDLWRSDISRVCKGIMHKTGDWTFSYKGEEAAISQNSSTI